MEMYNLAAMLSKSVAGGRTYRLVGGTRKALTLQEAKGIFLEYLGCDFSEYSIDDLIGWSSFDMDGNCEPGEDK